MYHHPMYTYGEPSEQRVYSDTSQIQTQQSARPAMVYDSSTSSHTPRAPQAGPSAQSFDYMTHHGSQQPTTSSISPQMATNSLYRPSSSPISPQMIKQHTSFDGIKQSYNYNSMPTSEMVLPQQQQHSPRQQQTLYNPININNMVHGSGVSSDLPTTLPPLNSTALSSPSRNIAQSSTSTPQYQTHAQLPSHQQHLPATLDRKLPQQQVPAQDFEQEFGPGLCPYGCGMSGCAVSFPVSNGLFYHMKSSHPSFDGIDKPYRCAMPGCTKRYKNINGLQYHLREAKGASGHGMAPQTEDNGKAFRCDMPGCKKAYRTANGLRYHQNHSHSIVAQPPAMPAQSHQHQRPTLHSQQQQTHQHPGLPPTQHMSLQQQQAMLDRQYHQHQQEQQLLPRPPVMNRLPLQTMSPMPSHPAPSLPYHHQVHNRQ
ncbi:hypothetical protein DM01DRAFT_1404123 [Hesseltinella vesiculosa]|uniref:C2H2-type domain-containing protein n=1 Tax=Hesseltinella vesiculosa TaxID=101127 RepID=A0A1X2GTE8_9FUNG|nr:hypothetical protein DM01DRAFT_1404123 [Hesseltinella vesiculosa]